MNTPKYALEQEAEEFSDEQLAAIYLDSHDHPAPYWTTDELQQTFKVISFLMPFVFVTRKEDNQNGTLTWIDLDCVLPGHYARLYFDFKPDHISIW